VLDAAKNKGRPPTWLDHVRFFVVAALIGLEIITIRDSWGVFPLSAVLMVILGYNGPWPPWGGARNGPPST
jgi:hypothetical protein